MIFAKPFAHDQALFDAALQEFVRHGYEQASINTILQAAGMSKGQFYHHFGNKEGLYLALIGVLIEQKQRFMSGVMQPDDFQQDIFGIFQKQIRYGLAFAREYPAINQFSESFVREKGNAIYDRVLTVYNLHDNAAIDGLVDRAIEQGQLRADFPRPLIKHIIGYLFTHSLDLTGVKALEESESALFYLIEFMRSGLANNDDHTNQKAEPS